MESEEVSPLLVFDVDGTLWSPEMYELWSGGGAPFKLHASSGNVIDRGGNVVSLFAEVRDVMNDLAQRKFVAAIASTCDEPEWARECLLKMRVGEQELRTFFHEKIVEIYKAPTKQTHFKRIKEKTGVEYHHMVFFDNQMNNIRDVQKLGVHCVYTPEGLTKKHYDEAIETFEKKFRKRK